MLMIETLVECDATLISVDGDPSVKEVADLSMLALKEV
jgi:hypothetical protein